MTPERWRRVEELFERASELPPPARDELLAVECADDRELYREVASLLVSDDHAEARLRGTIATAVEALSIAAAARAIGARLGPYRLVEILGEGGMGTVYLAHRDDDVYRGKVAIKILRHELASPQLISRFRDERRILASLDHPAIVRLLDGGSTESGLPYLVMEYVDGVPFAKHVRTLPVRERVALVARVAAAVQYAHQKLVVHRDLKPSNIVVDTNGAPKLLDFGIAKLLDHTIDEREAKTRTGMAVLTPEYASPEQARGEPVSVATDVYSAGAMLYDALVGKPPQHAGTSVLDTLRIICEVDPRRPSVAAPQLRRELAGDLDGIILKALHKRPRDRYASMAALIDDLERYLAGLPVHAREATLLYRGRKYVRRHRGKIAIAAAVTAALATATVVSIDQARRARDEAARAERDNVALLRERGYQELASGHAGPALPFLVETLRLGGDSAAIRFAIAEAMRPFQQELSTIDMREGVTGLALSAGGSRLALTGQAGTVRVMDTATGKLVLDAHVDGAWVTRPALSPDGMHLFGAGSDGVIRGWNTTTGALEHRFVARRATGAGLPITDLALMAGGTRVVTANLDGGVDAWDTDGAAIWTTEAGSASDPPIRLALAPGERRLAIALDGGTIAVVDPATGARVSELTGHTTRPEIRFTPDGRLISVGDSTARVWDVERGVGIVTVPGQTQALDVDREGARAVTSGPDGSLAIWDVRTGTRLVSLVGANRRANAAHFSRDGTRVVSTHPDNTFRVWDAATGVQQMVLESDPRGGTAPHSSTGAGDAEFFAGDTRLWTVCGVGVKIRRVDRAPLAGELAIGGMPLSAAWSPDAHTIAVVGGRGLFELWDGERFARIRRLDVTRERLEDVGYARDGRIAIAGEHGLAQIRDGRGELLRALAGHIGTVNHIAWSPDDAHVVTAGDDHSARIWDASSGTVAAVLPHPDRVLAAAWTHDGTRVATAGWDSKLRIWSSAGALLAVIDGTPISFLAIAWSPDDRRLAASGHGGELDVWEDTGVHLVSFVGHHGPVTAVAWSPDGELLASSADDETARVWDARTGAQLATRSDRWAIMDVRWSRDGSRLLTTSAKGTVRLWEVRRTALTVDELEDFVTQNVPFRLVDGRLEISK